MGACLSGIAREALAQRARVIFVSSAPPVFSLQLPESRVSFEDRLSGQTG